MHPCFHNHFILTYWYQGVTVYMIHVLQLDESGNPKESMNIHTEDGDHQTQSKPTKSPMATAALSPAKNFTADQVTPLPPEGNQDTLTVSLESTAIVPHSDAGISEVVNFYCINCCFSGRKLLIKY